MYAKRPLEKMEFLSNPDLPFPVSFYYGDRDWMNKETGIRVVGKNKYKNKYSHVYVVSDSDHHMYLDNPSEFA